MLGLEIFGLRNQRGMFNDVIGYITIRGICLSLFFQMKMFDDVNHKSL